MKALCATHMNMTKHFLTLSSNTCFYSHACSFSEWYLMLFLDTQQCQAPNSSAHVRAHTHTQKLTLTSPPAISSTEKWKHLQLQYQMHVRSSDEGTLSCPRVQIPSDNHHSGVECSHTVRCSYSVLYLWTEATVYCI